MRHADNDIDALVHQAVHLAILRKESEGSLRSLAEGMREVAEARRALASCATADDVGGMARGLGRLEAARAELAGAVHACGGTAGSCAAN